ncbi:hypothetical protein E2K93_15545 [Thalassotalea sp. HSM 43]|uniref:hypothetical protein n=1 Tax=Thalassotalea sp. HSM 43 TaxID=2552945 RepID=UPI00107FE718|nr:hypothetical protein [Thalassotalea sp. HSM 43]QBY05688.1 hypothetical protein E2K93_15545 [Thalassotalea sp. HSM 43]
MAKLKSIGIVFLAKLIALAFAGFGLIAGLLYAFVGLWADLTSTGVNWGSLFAFGAIVGMPVLFALVGFILGAMSSVAYNVVSAKLGGIEMDAESY